MNHFRRNLIAAYTGLSSPLRWGFRRIHCWRKRYPIAVLFYHRVANSHPTPWSISPEVFERQIRWLERRFDLISLAEAQHRIEFGNDRPAVAITFDDGYEENGEWAIPWLLDRQIPVTYYVSTGFVDSESPFPHDIALGLPLLPNRWKTLRGWLGGSLQFGGHTHSHLDLGRVLDWRTLVNEIVVASAELGRQLEIDVRDFAFPFGRRSNLHPWAFEVAARAGFRSVASAFGGRNQVGGDAFHLRRIHGDPELARLRNWLTDDPRTWFEREPQLPHVPLPPQAEIPTLDSLRTVKPVQTRGQSPVRRESTLRPGTHSAEPAPLTS